MSSGQAEISGQLSERSRLGTLRGIQILSTGSYVPAQVVTNDDLAQLDYDAEWIVQRTGIRQRRRLPERLATSDMACAAAERCLSESDSGGAPIDLVLVATMTPDRHVPSTACLVQERLGLRAAAMDVNAACAGFMYALVTAAQFVKTGTVRQALVIGADANSRIVDPHDRKTFPLFGDGAGAVLLGTGSEDQGLWSAATGCYCAASAPA